MRSIRSGLETAAMVRAVVYLTNLPLVCFPWAPILHQNPVGTDLRWHELPVWNKWIQVYMMSCGGYCGELPRTEHAHSQSCWDSCPLISLHWITFWGYLSAERVILPKITSTWCRSGKGVIPLPHSEQSEQPSQHQRSLPMGLCCSHIFEFFLCLVVSSSIAYRWCSWDHAPKQLLPLRVCFLMPLTWDNS